MPNYDAIVLGIGGVGSAALWQLALRGHRVLGLDRFTPPHSFGSSHGQSRIIRQAYFEHPDYTPLAIASYQLWDELSQRCGRQLYFQQGVLQVGPPKGEVIQGVLDAARQHSLDVEQLQPSDVEARWPTLSVPEGMVGVLEPQAGYLLVEQCVSSQLEAAYSLGAESICPAVVQSWQPGPPATVTTDVGTFVADRLIITCGAWASALMPDLLLELTVLRKSMFWYQSLSNGRDLERLPCFLFELPDGVFYGMPPIDSCGIKAAEHSGGQVVRDPLDIDRSVNPEDQERVKAFVRKRLDGLQDHYHDHATCMYTMSRDGHFIVDQHPQHRHVVYAAGLSGHGFKFAPVLGRALADLAIEGSTDLPMGFLRKR